VSPLHAIRVIIVLGAFLTACASPAGGPATGQPAARQEGAGSNRTLVVAVRAEPPSLSAKPFRSLGLTADLSRRMFNAGLTTRKDDGTTVPYLAESIPQLNTDAWRVSPDGTMETTYKLKPNLTWHDGRPLTADDFVFAHEVYSTPALGLSGSPPLSQMDRVTAPDAQTVVISWKQTFPMANTLAATGTDSSDDSFPPLPRHLLGQALQTQEAEAFMANSFWVNQYVGAGPYKFERWETGAFLEGVAFDGHVLGKPKIQRIREVFIGDPNTVMANMLAGEAQLTAGDSIRFTDGQTLKQQWGDRGKVLNFPNLYRIVQFQRRPEFATTAAFTDLRVRQALHHGVDFNTLNEAIQDDQTSAAVGPIPPTAGYYRQLQQAVPTYPYDPRRVEQLMQEAGFARGSDGVWTSPDPRFGRMSFETNVLASPDSDNEMHLMADAWRKLGFEVQEVSWSPAQGRDSEFRNRFPGLSTTSVPPGETALGEYRSDRLPTQQNRWRGSNRGGWQGNAEYDRLVDIYETGLDQNARTQAVIQMNRMLNEDCVVINLYWKLNAQAFVNALTGPRLTDPSSSHDWNIHEWELK
jgi:peptide/nickel transport system substrate-binding protein